MQSMEHHGLDNERWWVNIVSVLRGDEQASSAMSMSAFLFDTTCGIDSVRSKMRVV